jgi:AraC-like DNA-binding protein
VCPLFAEAPAWTAVGKGWRPLFGSYRDLGFSFEWHEFASNEEFNWGRSFHPGSIELCLNLDGRGRLSDGNQTVEFSPAFLKEHFHRQRGDVHPLVNSVVRGHASESAVVPPERLLPTLFQIVESLRHCPVFSPAQEMWFRSKALEVSAHLFFRPAQGESLCTRTQRLARERIEKANLVLQERMQDPPSLEELARIVNCSPFYLSRQFAQEGGPTMQQYLRRIRMERAAELLRSGKCNVTEAALEVGYNSLSHFSSTFHETFGCCPGLYPFKTVSQKMTPEKEAHSAA